jgi:hypothetical protein
MPEDIDEKGNMRAKRFVTDEQRCLTEAFDDNMGRQALLNEPPDLLQHLGGKKHNRGGTIANLRILGACDVNKSLGSWMNDIEQLENSGAVVCDLGLAARVDDKLVHAARAQRCRYGVCDRHARVDIG